MRLLYQIPLADPFQIDSNQKNTYMYVFCERSKFSNFGVFEILESITFLIVKSHIGFRLARLHKQSF